MRFVKVFFFLISIHVATLSANNRVKIESIKDLPYIPVSRAEFSDKKHRLDVYYPLHTNKQNPVLVFFHGGSWEYGDKSSYSFLGKNMAKKGVVCVIVNYRLGPEFNIDQILEDGVEALDWIQRQIPYYSGDPDKIFVSGHSAGGYIAAMLGWSNECFALTKRKNPIKGVILNDAFGLDINFFIKDIYKPKKHKMDLYALFGEDPESWQSRTALNYIGRNEVPSLVLFGKKSYGIIQRDAEYAKAIADKEEVFLDLHAFPKKRHVPMMRQMVFKNNVVYDLIIEFMNSEVANKDPRNSANHSESDIGSQ